MSTTTTKKVIQRNLPLTHTYELVWVKNGSIESGDTWQCENCNAGITNMACIRNESGETHIVGLDCMKTLTLKPTIESMDLMYDYNQFTSFIAKCNKAKVIELTPIMAFLELPRPKGGANLRYMHSTQMIDKFMGLDKFSKQYQDKLI